MMLPYLPEKPVKAAPNCPVCRTPLTWRETKIVGLGTVTKWWCEHCRAFHAPH